MGWVGILFFAFLVQVENAEGQSGFLEPSGNRIWSPSSISLPGIMASDFLVCLSLIFVVVVA